MLSHFLHRKPSCLNIDKYAIAGKYIDKSDIWEEQINRVLAKVSTIAAVLALLATLVMAQKTINLTAIDGYPPKASWGRAFVNFYIPAINKELAVKGNYKIQWN